MLRDALGESLDQITEDLIHHLKNLQLDLAIDGELLKNFRLGSDKSRGTFQIWLQVERWVRNRGSTAVKKTGLKAAIITQARNKNLNERHDIKRE